MSRSGGKGAAWLVTSDASAGSRKVLDLDIIQKSAESRGRATIRDQMLSNWNDRKIQ
jgi:hypothetical protein